MVETVTLTAGFSDPVLSSQSVFRSVLEAMANPGRLIDLSVPLPETQTQLPQGLAMILLTLADYETPVFLDAPFNTDSCRKWIVFHTGATLTQDSKQARFAVLSAETSHFACDQFDLGDARYPDRSCTLLIACPSLEDGLPITLQGPGIQTTQTIAPQGLDPHFWRQLQNNHRLFPLGIDVVLCTKTQILALPRTTQCIMKDAA
jgi:alpha-D-ribose 1-methylphosphonate 5-triphosphate synthase subunit PhnH